MKGNSPLFSNYSTGSSYSNYGSDKRTSSPLKGQSQPFQEEYSVYSKMKEKDITHGVYNPNGGGYSKNPTSKKLEDAIVDGFVVCKSFTGSIPYVIDTNEDVIVGKRNGNGRNGVQTPHPTLIGGIDPKVKMAGMLHIKNGKIMGYDDRSGHYRPNLKSMEIAHRIFKKYTEEKQ